MSDSVCKSCGSKNVRKDLLIDSGEEFDILVCNSCGKWWGKE